MSGTTEKSGDEYAALHATMESFAKQNQELMRRFFDRDGAVLDPLGLNQAVIDFSIQSLKNPEKILDAQMQAWKSWFDLWMHTGEKLIGNNSTTSSLPPLQDKRFRHESWEENPFFDYIRRSYLIVADAFSGIVDDTGEMEKESARKLAFYTRQFIDSLSPANFAATNPEVIQETIDTNGQNLLKGLQNLHRDIDPKTGQLRISMVDTDAFEPGRNIAVSPGSVIYQNELMQLIQYAPATTEVFSRPLLIIPPWINKFYILDLQPKNSLIKWLVGQGYTVFVISWRNPDESLRDKDFEDYLIKGPLAALDVIEQATRQSGINVVGYCIGGTLLSATLAWMKQTGDSRIHSATFFVTLIDFSDPGDLGVFIDEQQVKHLENSMNERGFHDGREMAMTFNLLRSRDLIWNFYINNYLLGKEPPAFDLLYWNADSTRMPARMHSTYLRKMYLENTFKDPGGYTVRGIPLDISKIDAPAYFISTEEDHIAPWKSTYLGARRFSGPVRFVLGRSGHIAGIINPPAANKYGYYTGPEPDMDADAWYRQTEYHAGSWWPDWHNWLQQYAGNRVSARQPGQGTCRALEPAPGSYVKVRY